MIKIDFFIYKYYFRIWCMVSITRLPIKISEEHGLPQELVTPIFEKADLCDKVIKLTDEGISIYDFNTGELIRTIKSKYYFSLSVSNCGTFAVGSNEHYPVHIWNINNGLSVKIDQTFDNQISSPLHTFSLNNELLVTNKNCIYSYEFSQTSEVFSINYVYKITNDVIIIYITSNKTEHMFACALDSGEVYIFNSLMKVQTIVLDRLIIPVDDYIKSLTFEKQLLFVVANNMKIILNLATKTKVVLQKPKPVPGLIHYINVNNFYLLNCLTKAIGSSNGLSFMWDVNTGRIIKRLNISVSSLNGLTPGSTKLVSCNRHKNDIHIIDLDNLC